MRPTLYMATSQADRCAATPAWLTTLLARVIAWVYSYLGDDKRTGLSTRNDTKSDHEMQPGVEYRASWALVQPPSNMCV